ncbi:MAG: hypothetical protein ACR2JO_05625 [Mycobacteriales bacterium]
MPGMDDPTVLLRGGSRDGETTTLSPAVTRLYAVSDAPGMLDVYEATEQRVNVPGNDVTATVFEWVTQEPADGVAPEALHMHPGH